MAAQFQLVMHSGPDTGKVYPLEASEIIIGRDTNNSIIINDPEVSRKHAKLTLQISTYTILDLGSTNGTFINGQRITASQELKPGDTVTLGENIVLMFETGFDPNATVVSSAQMPKVVAPIRNSIQSPAPIPSPTPTPAPAFIPASVQAPVQVPAAPPSPSPAEVFTSQPPAGPVSKQAAPAKKKFPIWLIIVIILLIIICACVGFFLIIDQLSLWCTILPWLVPLLGGTCA